ncbi:MAG: LysM peptidoglycan-binding domain-containing protein [Desulfobacter sp.]|nr:MAG: LysM peptidoglycan-binding domain-containing protein [Desulfobacter sp.]
MNQILRVISIWTMVLLLVPVSGISAWAQAPQPFDTDEDQGFYYTIQKGDTLWDLSQKFYSSQWDWPGLWEINKEIKNPHWIYPGNKIRVYLKSADKQPLPQPAVQPAKPKVAVAPKFNYPGIDKVGFIKNTQENSLGEIIRERDGNLMMSANDIIYIKPTGVGALIPGAIYQIFTTEPVREKTGSTVFTGIKHLIKAEVEILENKVQYARAIIKKSYRDATVGDKIMAFYKRESMLPVQPAPCPH